VIEEVGARAGSRGAAGGPFAQRDSCGREFLIRPARAADADAVSAVMAELAAADDFTLVSPEEVVLDNVRRADELARAAAASDRWYMAVVEQDGQVVGLLDMRAVPMRRCGHVMELGIGIRRRATDRGIGTALLRHALRAATSLGYRKVRLFVIASNARAVHVYGDVGFRETGRFLGEVTVRERLEDLIVMERPLP